MEPSEPGERAGDAPSVDLPPEIGRQNLRRGGVEEMTPALRAYVARTESFLDLFALLTIWLTVVPWTPSLSSDQGWWWTVGRVALSAIFGVDLLIRARLSGHPLRYVRHHVALAVAVVAPPVRILFSLRLLRAMFARGNLGQFLGVALLLMLNGAVIVYAFESGAQGSNIETMGDALWWTIVTVATVGYGDFTPVTVGGRMGATLLMVLAIVVAAVVTAQIASNFSEQAERLRAAGDVPPGEAEAGTSAGRTPTAHEPATVGPVSQREHAELVARLDRIEQLLRRELPADDPPGST